MKTVKNGEVNGRPLYRTDHYDAMAFVITALKY
jgi:hypothetical protein